MKKYLLSAIIILLCQNYLLCYASDKAEKIKHDDTNLSKVTGDVTIYVTTNDRVYDFTEVSVDYNTPSNMSTETITLDPDIRYQQIHGFGAAITGSTSYNLLQMNDEDRSRFLNETFCHENGLGFSYVRISIGCSDFSLSEYTCCDKYGIENFSLQEEELNYVIPVLQEILKINPDLKIKGAPWTSPRWMKVNNLTDLEPYNSWTGGHLNPKYYEDYASYFVKWIEAFAEHGVEITSVSPQNEPLHTGNSASLFMGWEEQKEFVKVMGAKFEEAGLNTKIYVFDHNYNYDDIKDQFNYPINIYNDPLASQYITGAAYHNYGGDREEMINIHNQAPDKELIFSEASIGTWNDGRNFEKRLTKDMEELGLGTINNWCKAVIVWNLMLDTERGPNRPLGCRTCYGAVDIDINDYETITRNSHYYVIGHMSSVVKPGAVRIGSSGFKKDGFSYAAFENLNGNYAFVLLNDTNEERYITLIDGNNHFSYMVPAKSVVSYKWNNDH